MGAADAIEGAKDAAREWRSLRAMPAPRITGTEALPVHLVEVDDAFEKRSLERDIEAAPESATPQAPPLVDPWSIDVDAPRDGSAWSARVGLDGHGVMVCLLCQGRRQFDCDDCGGSGQKLVEEHDPITGRTVRYYVPCGTCAGSGRIICDMCEGNGKVKVRPAVAVATGTSTERALVHGGRLDPALVAEILGSGSALPLSASRLVESAEDGALRTLPPEVAATARGLLARAAEEGTRSHGRRVRVYAGWIVILTLPGRTLHVFGDPPRVAGDDEPVTANHTTIAMVAAGVAALALAGTVVYLLS